MFGRRESYLGDSCFGYCQNRGIETFLKISIESGLGLIPQGVIVLLLASKSKRQNMILWCMSKQGHFSLFSRK